MNVTYSQQGDYFIPNLTLQEQEQHPIGKYGLMHQQYLKEHRRITYNRLLLKEQLNSHLWEIDQIANRRLEQMMTELTDKFPPPDKATDQMGWVGHMNNLKAQAEEILLKELIYN